MMDNIVTDGAFEGDAVIMLNLILTLGVLIGLVKLQSKGSKATWCFVGGGLAMLGIQLLSHGSLEGNESPWIVPSWLLLLASLGMLWFSGRESHKSEAALRNRRLVEVGMKTASTVHDFRNVLTAIRGSLDLASLSSSEGNENLSSAIRGGFRAVARAEGLVSSLLDSTQKPDLTPWNTNKIEGAKVNELALEVESALNCSLGGQIELSLDLDGSVGMVDLDPNELYRLLMNLGTNAIDAMPHGGRLLISTRVLDSSVVIGVQDTGHGISKRHQSRIYVPFFSTKSARGAKGYGLGLSQVKSAVDAAGGTLYCRTAMGRGTHFEIRLPALSTPSRLESRAVRPGTSRAGNVSAGERETVLV